MPTIKQIKKIVRNLKEIDGCLDDLVPALLDENTLVAKVQSFWNGDRKIIQIERWMLRHLQFNEDCTQWRWKSDKKTLKLLEKAGIAEEIAAEENLFNQVLSYSRLDPWTRDFFRELVGLPPERGYERA